MPPTTSSKVSRMRPAAISTLRPVLRPGPPDPPVPLRGGIALPPLAVWAIVAVLIPAPVAAAVEALFLALKAAAGAAAVPTAATFPLLSDFLGRWIGCGRVEQQESVPSCLFFSATVQ